ncbi:hypothetical protein [Bradyrhizobium sp. SYSU BS000235]|uniref:hypothetical protein n=1 Tax=Bradyrhizobium sp. SYSU BS000235 TaxID=3411332 RepID=UPI003C76A171
MRLLILAAACAGALSATPSLAQTNAPAANSPSSDKTETSCNTAAPSTTTGNADKTTGTSTAMEKSAILPSAGGHASSAAPTVQSDGKPMEARPDCPPETKK